MSTALDVADGLDDGASVISVHTIKPLDQDGIVWVLKNFKRVVVIEEHAPQGGLAAMTKQIAWDIGASCDLHTFTLQDAFIHNYGNHADLLKSHGLESRAILKAIGG